MSVLVCTRCHIRKVCSANLPACCTVSKPHLADLCHGLGSGCSPRSWPDLLGPYSQLSSHFNEIEFNHNAGKWL